MCRADAAPILSPMRLGDLALALACVFARHDLELEVEPCAAAVCLRQERELVERQRPRDR
jgi:hypothetical protein